jgi:hypothetical protein
VKKLSLTICCFSLTFLAISSRADTFATVASADTTKLAVHIKQLEGKLPADSFTVVSEPPFAVIGNEASIIVHDRAVHTISWAVNRLKQDFFEHDPPHIIDIWMMKDQPSYETCARSILGRTPPTPLGFYARASHALVINLSAGTGTIVHEIVHPFMHANFAQCPPWFNEGLASLFEAASERNGHIIGLTNWRLPYLQRLIRTSRCPAIAEVTAMDEAEFSLQDQADHYAVARYLCYYLQESGLLIPFCRAFHANCQTDPTGLNALQQILHEPDMDRLQIKWEKFVRTLTVNK